MSSVEALKKDLSSRYDLLSFVDLGDITKRHGAVFDIFRSIYQHKFRDNQRIVFYTSYRPSLTVLEHVQLAGSRIDISNWFVMICCPDDITQDLRLANEKHGYDQQSIAWYPCDLDSTKPLELNNIVPQHSLCYAPFNSLYVVHDTGAVRPCCKFEGSIGNIQQQSLSEIWQGEAVQNLRSAMKQGHRPKECRVCWEADHTKSFRSHFQLKFQDVSAASHIDDPKMINVNVSPGSVCNFKCRICDEYSSTAIAAEEFSFATDPEIKKSYKLKLKGTYPYDLETYKNLVMPMIQDVRYLKILGGEPLLIPGLIEWLEELVIDGYSDHIALEINSNSSTWSSEFITIAKKFKHFEILLSIDDLGSRFEIQRGGKWDQVDQIVSKWISYKSPTFEVKVSPAVNLQNLLYLDQLVEYFQTKELEVVWTYLEFPGYFCIDAAPDAVRTRAVEKYKNHPCEELRSIAARLQKPGTEFDIAMFLSQTNKFDQRRNQDFRTSHQELMDLIDPVPR